MTFPSGLRAQSKADVSEFTGLFQRVKAYLDATQGERRTLGRAFGATGLQRLQDAGNVLQIREQI